MKGAVTEADRQRAKRLIAAICAQGYRGSADADADAVAAELAAIREEVIACAVARVEREFRVKPRAGA